MIKKRIPDQYKRAYWIFSRAGLVLVGVGGSYLLLSDFTSIRMGPRLTATGIIASGILTFALIAVYRDIGQIQGDQAEKMGEQRDLQKEVVDIQNQQKEIMSNQENLMEASYEPILQVLDIDSYGQFLWPKIRNIGNGPMNDMGVKLHFYVEDQGTTIDSEGDPLTHSADSDAIDLPAGEAGEIGSLSPGQIGKLAAAVRTPRLEREGEGRLGHLMNDLADRDIEEVVYQIEIYYDHLMRTKGTGRHFLMLRKVEVQRHLSVDSMIRHGEEYTNPELYTIAPNFREPGTYYDDD